MLWSNVVTNAGGGEEKLLTITRGQAALEYIGPDEYVEATPKNLRLRKKILDETKRKRAEQNRVMKIVAE